MTQTSTRAIAARTERYLARIARLEPRLGAFAHVDADGARRRAAALKGRTGDFALCGWTIAIKDLFAVDGMPLRAGSRLDVGAAAGGEGSVVAALRRAGTVILGKTRTTEFALGGFNVAQPPPLNPYSGAAPLDSGGSSHGSAVAAAAGLCDIAVGSDTGGSVRLPAAFCGAFGYKASRGAFALDGALPLAPPLDSLGLFARSASALSEAVAALRRRENLPPPGLSDLRIGVPKAHFLDDLEASVATAFDAALAALARAGARLQPLDLPEAAEIESIFSTVVPIELLATLGIERVEAEGHLLDPVVRQRLTAARAVPAAVYAAARRRLETLRALARRRLDDFDAFVTPTAPVRPLPVAALADAAVAATWVRRAARATRPVNMFDLCAVSVPHGPHDEGPPAALQIACAYGADRRLLAITEAVARVLPAPAPPPSPYAPEADG